MVKVYTNLVTLYGVFHYYKAKAERKQSESRAKAERKQSEFGPNATLGV
jgi:hypothetical protein